MKNDAVDLAIIAFNEFVGAWLGPAAQRYVWAAGNTHADRVRQAIRNVVDSAERDRTVGYGVFQKAIDTTYDRDRPSGYIYTLTSAIFEQPPTNALAYCQANKEGDYVILAVQEIE